MVNDTTAITAPQTERLAAEAPADLKARLALASLRGDPAPWNTVEAQQAGVTADDVMIWQDILTSHANRLFDPAPPDTLTALRRERDELKGSLARRFDELAVLTRLLEGRRQLIPRISKAELRERRQTFRHESAEWRKSIAHLLGTVQIRIVRALPTGLKRRIKAMLFRLRG